MGYMLENARGRRLAALADHVRGPDRTHRAIAFRRLVAWAVVAVGLLVGIDGAPSRAEEISKEQMQGLDEQVQEIKSDVLAIAAELSLLEEKLLYPSNTQVAIFVSLEEGETSFLLDSVRIQIDGEPVAHHIYSFKEVEALQKGGVQRIYTGNVATGEHELAVSLAGKQPGGEERSETRSFAFRKDVAPKLVGITLSDSGGDSIELGSW